ncbi:hypothetical protein ACFQ00_07840 [Sphingosinicella xenopeptidilytica]|uniref:Uncharacterized protein n=1 Tax=Sphingosinicella xenopeptidilytica TaxID=364098 RepID=A0ABW3C143_SPHXN
MTHQERIDQAKSQVKSALVELERLIGEGASDTTKEVVADQINALQDQISRLGGLDA